MTEHLPVAGLHAPANIDDRILAEQGHRAGDHLCYSSGDTILVFWIDNPTIDARHDLVRLPARRCGFHGAISSLRAGPRSSGWKFAAAMTGSEVLIRAACGERGAFSSRSSVALG